MTRLAGTEINFRSWQIRQQIMKFASNKSIELAEDVSGDHFDN